MPSTNAAELVSRGRSLRLAGQHQEAILCFDEAIRRDPTLATAHAGRAAALVSMGLEEPGLDCYRESLRLRPDFAPVWNAMGLALLRLARVPEAVDHFRRAIDLSFGYYEAYSNFLFALLYDPLRDPASLLAEHRGYGARFDRSHQAAPHANDRSPRGHRRLRIGYVSPDFVQHPVRYFLEPVLAHHNRDAFHLTGYSDVEKPTAVTEMLSSYFEVWRPVSHLNDQQLAETIRADQIDILVDLCGHCGLNRLPMFGLKPAPVQISYIGYPFSTGMAGAIDYRVTDAAVDPPGQTEAFSTERLLRLPGCFTCYLPPELARSLEVRRPSPQPGGSVTFGSFSRANKWSDASVRAWAAILRAAPHARLLLHSGRSEAQSLGPEAAARTLGRIIHPRFAQYGVAPERVEVAGFLAPREHLEYYGEVDLMLDTFPYHGTTATCEALWMGVPVLTHPGDCHVSRVGVSLLRGLGLPELVAANEQEYVDTAVALANDPVRLAALGDGVRERFRRSPAMDHAGVTRALEDAYTEAWSRWCGEVVE